MVIFDWNKQNDTTYKPIDVKRSRKHALLIEQKRKKKKSSSSFTMLSNLAKKKGKLYVWPIIQQLVKCMKQIHFMFLSMTKV